MAALGPEDESQWGRQGPEAEKSPPRRARRGPCPPPYPQHESLFLQGCQGSPVGKVLSKNLPNLKDRDGPAGGRPVSGPLGGTAPDKQTWVSVSERKIQRRSCTQRPGVSGVTLPLTRLGKVRLSPQNAGQGCQVLTTFLLNGGTDRSELSHGTKTRRIREASSDSNSKFWMHGEP